MGCTLLLLSMRLELETFFNAIYEGLLLSSVKQNENN